jgi:hypothetical protein
VLQDIIIKVHDQNVHEILELDLSYVVTMGYWYVSETKVDLINDKLQIVTVICQLLREYFTRQVYFYH